MQYQEYLLTLRSKNTHMTDTFKVRVFADETPEEIADRQAKANGAIAESMVRCSDWQE